MKTENLDAGTAQAAGVNHRVAKAATRVTKSLQWDLEAHRLMALDDLQGVATRLQSLTRLSGVSEDFHSDISIHLASCRGRLTAMQERIDKARLSQRSSS